MFYPVITLPEKKMFAIENDSNIHENILNENTACHAKYQLTII